MNILDLYEMTLYELKIMLEGKRKGLAEHLYKEAVIIGRLFNKDFPKTSEEAFPELFPPKKTYKVSSWIIERYQKQNRR